ncbi:MAG: GNAT family N-acetyltransferase [Pseudomonadota bacterium]
MTDTIVIRAAETPRDLAAVQKLCWEYRDFLLGFDDSMRSIVDTFYPLEAYAALIDSLAEKHARPKGIILLAEQDGTAIGCGMYHPLNGEDCEIKRVFLRDTARGSGTGEALSRALIEQAREDGYRRILLDTNAKFTGARKLYEKLGFAQRNAYSDIPADVLPYLVFYELKL